MSPIEFAVGRFGSDRSPKEALSSLKTQVKGLEDKGFSPLGGLIAIPIHSETGVTLRVELMVPMYKKPEKSLPRSKGK